MEEMRRNQFLNVSDSYLPTTKHHYEQHTLNICCERAICYRQKATSRLLIIQLLTSVISQHYWTSLLPRKIKTGGRYTLPHLLLCIFKAFRYKVDILKSCDETFLFAGNLGVKGLYFGMSRKCMLEDKESGNQRILFSLITFNTQLPETPHL